jgi:hypothetical protein
LFIKESLIEVYKKSLEKSDALHKDVKTKLHLKHKVYIKDKMSKINFVVSYIAYFPIATSHQTNTLEAPKNLSVFDQNKPPL